jgi:hypothetical protein
MFALIESLLSPKVKARAIMHVAKMERSHFIQNIVKSWGLPGNLRILPSGLIDIELEGRQATLRARIEELSHNPLISSNVIKISWLPYTGNYKYLSVSF